MITLTQRLLDYRAANPATWAKIILDEDLKKDLLDYPKFSELCIQQKAAAIILGCIPVCECGSPLKFDSKTSRSPYSTPYGRWIEFCSTKCARSSKSVVARREQTNLERYGSTSWAKSDVGRDAASKPWSSEKKAHFNESYRATVQSRYGVDHYSKTPEYLKSRTLTILEKTEGKFTNCFQDVDKIKKACFERYGTESWSQTSIGRKRLSDNNVMKGPSIALKSRMARMSGSARYDEKLLQILLTRDNDSFKSYIEEVTNSNGFKFRQELAHHLGLSYSFLNNLLRTYGMSSYLLTIGCGISHGEVEVLKFVESLDVGEVTSGDRTIIAPREIDILVKSRKFGIEYDGIYTHSEFKGGKDSHYHVNKTHDAEAAGYSLLHIFENEWADPTKREIWKSIIRSKLGVLTVKIGARSTMLRPIDAAQARQFLDRTHLSGFVGASVHLGLFRDDTLVSVLSYGPSRFSGKGEIEIEIYRFASELNTLVMGAFGKFMKSLSSEVKSKLVSFADRRTSGTTSIYDNFFKGRKTLGPSWYLIEAGHLKHRLSATKHKLIEMLGDDYDHSASVVDNMVAVGLDRIWDCGCVKYSTIVP